MATRTSSLSPLLILVTTAIVAWAAPQQSKGGGSVGGACSPINPVINTTAEAGCRPDSSGVYYDGDCTAQLLQRGPCPYLHWLVLDKGTGRARCQFQVCPDHKALVGGQCERLGEATSRKYCLPTQQLIITESGEPQCECPLGMAYYGATKQCYHPYEQGPCQQGHTLQVVFRGDQATVECVASPCPSGEVALTLECAEATTSTPSKDYRCYKLSTPGPCKQGFLAVEPLFKKVTCIDNKPYTILDIMNSACSPGSKRASRGRCRKEFVFAGRRKILGSYLTNRAVIRQEHHQPIVHQNRTSR